MSDTSDRTGNQVLDGVTPDERRALVRDAQARPIVVGNVRRRPGDAVDMVIFPTRGTYSVLVDADGDEVEAATIGREGVVDAPAALGSRVARQILLAQIEGEALEVPIEMFLKVYDQGPRLRMVIHGYIEALFVQASMSAACHALHELTERCARWLLQSHDRVQSDTFELKREFLARMLGSSRQDVTVATQTLQTAGLIMYQRGKVTVVDRPTLEDAACPCYEAIATEYSRLVPLE